ncbi:Gldg family protein [Alteripontixanthobacter muriae]|uniref:Gldg family protein n=1 Tax=Alteripontixanthobacter muriae TaxID=2705546 RepID=UPI001E60501E|nr:ABC transporter [Alteripontixanthobacter muriae]
MWRRRTAALHAFLGAALLAGCSGSPDVLPADDQVAAAAASAERQSGQPALGLLTTLPIYWTESPSFAGALTSDIPLHWAREWLARQYDLRPVDTLDAGTLARLDHLLLAQPRALSGMENVALDQWVRDGGEVLLFADPRLTGHSIYPIGDRRRPQDVVLLSPILKRWGLDLTFDESQPLGESSVDVLGQPLPVNLEGSFRPVATSADAPSDCRMMASGLVAQCVIGEGRAVIVADAALLEDGDHGAENAPQALDALLDAAFGTSPQR